jgi:hypothetical protein
MYKRLVIACLFVLFVGGILLVLKGSNPTASKFVMPSPFPTFDPLHATFVDIKMPPMQPVEAQNRLVNTNSAKSTDEPHDLNWTQSVMATWTAEATSDIHHNVVIPIATAGPAQSDEECGDASVLMLTNDGVRTSLLGDTLFVFFDYDGHAYKFSLKEAEWMIDGVRQPVNQQDASQAESLKEGQIEEICYYSRTQVSADELPNKDYYLYQLNGTVLLFPKS